MLIAPRSYATSMNLHIISGLQQHQFVNPTFLQQALVSNTLTALAATGSSSSSDNNNKEGRALAESNRNPFMSLSHNDRMNISPRPRAVIFMAIAMALHFGGYEFIRNGNLALFTSSEFGFSSPVAFPFAMGMISPFSFMLLMGYGKQLQDRGPRVALRNTTLFSVLFIGLTAAILKLIQKYFHNAAIITLPFLGQQQISLRLLFSQMVVGLAFIFQQSYSHLLYAQQWSFIGSVLSPEEGSTWFAAIAGLSSVLSTITGSIVGGLVNRVGLFGLLACTCLTLTASLLAADRAYSLSERHGFDPAEEMMKKQEEEKKKKEQLSNLQSSSANTKIGKDDKGSNDVKKNKNLMMTALELFRRVPTLGALFLEVLSFQSLSTILNVSMVTQLKGTITDDTARAIWSGRFFALTNAVSGAFQFLILPIFMKRMEPALVWKVMPLIPLLGTLVQYMCHNTLQVSSSTFLLNLLAYSFFGAKVMDYSIRGVVNEMVYQPLDFESRYLGKEIIGVLGSRFGKSGMSLILSFMTFLCGTNNFGNHQLSQLSVIASFLWLLSGWKISQLVPRKATAQKDFMERQQREKQKRS